VHPKFPVERLVSATSVFGGYHNEKIFQNSYHFLSKKKIASILAPWQLEP
jgi:hypothetical protein